MRLMITWLITIICVWTNVVVSYCCDSFVLLCYAVCSLTLLFRITINKYYKWKIITIVMYVSMLYVWRKWKWWDIHITVPSSSSTYRYHCHCAFDLDLTLWHIQFVLLCVGHCFAKLLLVIVICVCVSVCASANV